MVFELAPFMISEPIFPTFPGMAMEGLGIPTEAFFSQNDVGNGLTPTTEFESSRDVSADSRPAAQNHVVRPEVA